jgi:hypothetical protein
MNADLQDFKYKELANKIIEIKATKSGIKRKAFDNARK